MPPAFSVHLLVERLWIEVEQRSDLRGLVGTIAIPHLPDERPSLDADAGANQQTIALEFVLPAVGQSTHAPEAMGYVYGVGSALYL